MFPGQDDRLLLNWGDGTFRDITRPAQITGKNGKGLGIVAADFTTTGKLSLFVANDGTPNFFYENVTPTGEPIPRFAENGVLSGLAYDRNDTNPGARWLYSGGGMTIAQLVSTDVSGETFPALMSPELASILPCRIVKRTPPTLRLPRIAASVSTRATCRLFE